MRIVVTGASGYIGMHLVRALRDFGNVVAVVRPNSRQRVPVDVQTAEADITDFESVVRHLQRDDRIVHLACLPIGPSEADPRRALLVNSYGTLNILHGAMISGAARVVVASSAHVYGRPVTVPMDENHPTRPTTAYGASKLAGELFVPTYQSTYTDGAAVLRIFNVFGYSLDGRRRPTFETLVTERVGTSHPTPIYGSSADARDFVHVGDVVQALVAAINCTVTGIYNIGSGKACRLQCIALGAGILRENIKFMASNMAPPIVFEAAIDRATKDLGFRPTVNVLDFVRSLRPVTARDPGQVDL